MNLKRTLLSIFNSWHRRLVIILLILVAIFRYIPGLGDFYTQSIYPLIATPLSTITGFIPICVGEIIYALIIGWFIWYPIYTIQSLDISWKETLGNWIEGVAWIYVWFYLAWGLNYSQSNLLVRAHIQPANYSKELLQQFAYEYLDSLNASYTNISQDSNAYHISDLAKQREIATRQQVVDGYYRIEEKKLGIHAPFNNVPHVKTMLYTPLYSKFGVSGSMAPFTAEFTISGDLMPTEYASTYAHEYAHLLGVANEGEATFYSYLCCTMSKDKATKYSGYLSIYMYVLRALENEDPKLAKNFLSHTDPRILNDKQASINHWRALYSDLLGRIQHKAFELYLQSNHVDGGTKSYSQVIGLLISYKQKEKLAINSSNPK